MSNKPRTWEECSPADKERIAKYVVPIYEWIRDNKHTLEKGVTNSYHFCHVVPCNGDREGTFANARENNIQRGRYANLLSGLKSRGFLFYRQELPKQPRVWAVNEAILPPGTVDYTGIRHTIPLAEQKPESSGVMASHQEACQAFLESELKSIKVQECTLGNGQLNYTAEMRLHDVTLWDIYKIGLAMEQTITTKYARETSAPGTIKEAASTGKGEENKQEAVAESEQQPTDSVVNQDTDFTSDTVEGAAF